MMVGLPDIITAFINKCIFFCAFKQVAGASPVYFSARGMRATLTVKVRYGG